MQATPISVPTAAKYCSFCPHAAHGQVKCPACKCKGKAKWWQKLLSAAGNAAGEAKFGGN